MSNIEGMFRTYLVENGFKVTKQRLAIARVIEESPGHLSLDELLDIARKVSSGVGYATVYRTMRLLTEAGITTEHRFGKNVRRYELATTDHHDHLICKKCGNIVEFHDEIIEDRQDMIAQQYGFEVVGHRHLIYGICCGDAEARKVKSSIEPGE